MKWLIFLFFVKPICLTVDSTKEMLGTYSPQAEPYTHELPEDTTPSGIFARGSYTARTRVSVKPYSDTLLFFSYKQYDNNGKTLSQLFSY